MASGKNVSVKLTVDKQKNRVVFAESNHEFVDILFSFLTMPLGAAIRVLGKNSSLGSFTNIYDSAAKFDPQYLQTEACKNMLLHPRNAAAVKCEDLAINLGGDKEPRIFYICQDCSKYRYTSFFYSSIPDTRCCSCGEMMSYRVRWEREDMKAHGDGVFVKGGLTFVTYDDLNIVALASSVDIISQFESRCIYDTSVLEERPFNLGPEEIASLLWRSLISKTPLTDLCLSKPGKDDDDAKTEHTKEDMVRPKITGNVDSNVKEIRLKLVLNKSSNKILFIEVGEDMVDFLFSFLTFPLGSFITNNILDGSIVNVHKSLESNSFLNSDGSMSLLLSPKLACFHGCSSQLLETEEVVSEKKSFPGLSCFKELNPKSPYKSTDGGGYARVQGKYMVTDDLRVLPLSLLSFAQILNEFKISSSCLVVRQTSMEVTQAFDLARAAFVSRTALTDVFCSVEK